MYIYLFILKGKRSNYNPIYKQGQEEADNLKNNNFEVHY